MARQPRIDIGDYPYHIINRANTRLKVFFKDSDYKLDDNHLLSVIRYVERNPLRAGLVKKAENWEFNSLSKRLVGKKFPLAKWPIYESKDYLDFVNQPMNASEVEAIRSSVQKSKVFGSEQWREKISKKYDIPLWREKAGRPKKNGGWPRLFQFTYIDTKITRMPKENKIMVAVPISAISAVKFRKK